MVILKLKDKSEIAIKKMKQFFKDEFEYTEKEIYYNDKYMYVVTYNNYKEKEEVEEIMKEFNQVKNILLYF